MHGGDGTVNETRDVASQSILGSLDILRHLELHGGHLLLDEIDGVLDTAVVAFLDPVVEGVLEETECLVFGVHCRCDGVRGWS